MKSYSEVIDLIRDYFAPAGINIIVTPVEEYTLDNGGFDLIKKQFRPTWIAKYLDRNTIEVSDEAIPGYIIHECIHLTMARPAFDPQFNSDTFHWVDRKNHDLRTVLSCEDVMYVGFGWYIATALGILDEIEKYSCINPEQDKGLRRYKGNDIFIDQYWMRGCINNGWDNLLSMAGVYEDGYIVGRIDIDRMYEGFETLVPILKKLNPRFITHVNMKAQRENYLGLKMHPDSDLADFYTNQVG